MKTKRFIIGLVAVLLATLSVGFVGVSAAENDESSVAGVAINTPQPPGAITGIVTFGEDVPMVNSHYGSIILYNASDWQVSRRDNSVFPADTESDETSEWSWQVADVPAGTYLVCVQFIYVDPQNTKLHQCYGGQTLAEATAITVGVGESLNGIVIPFEQPEHVIRGTAMDDLGEPVEGVMITSYPKDWLPLSTFSTVSNPDGSYEIPASNGEYTLSLRAPATHILDHSSSVAIPAVNGADVTFDINAERLYEISGNLIPLNDGSLYPISPVQSSGLRFAVVAYEPDGNYAEGDSYDQDRDYDGAYTLRVAAGTYRICILPPYQNSLYGEVGEVCYEDGSDVVVGNEDNITDIDIYLDLPTLELGTILGSVISSDGVPIHNMYIDLRNDSSTTTRSLSVDTVTVEDGLFEFVVPMGSYRLYAHPNIPTLCEDPNDFYYDYYDYGDYDETCNQFSGAYEGLTPEDGLYVTVAQSETVTATFTAIPRTQFSEELRLVSGSDAVEERADGTMYLNSSDLEIGRDAGANQLIGLRYQNVDIPPNVTITDAKLSFTIDEPQSEPAFGMFFGDAAVTGNAVPFTDTINNISNRERTTTSVTWDDIPTWDENKVGRRVESPSLIPIIQEIIDNPEWLAGNSLAIIIEGEGRRAVASYNDGGSIWSAPILQIDYSTAEQPNIPLAVHLQSTTAMQHIYSSLISIVDMFIVLGMLTMGQSAQVIGRK